MKIYTGYFAKIKQYREAGLVTISIARFNRYYSGLSMKILAPPADIIHYEEDKYLPIYKSQLNKLSAEGIYQEIEKLSQGMDCILLCYEKPSDFCHRHLVSKWLNEKLKLNIEEYKQKDSTLF